MHALAEVARGLADEAHTVAFRAGLQDVVVRGVAVELDFARAGAARDLKRAVYQLRVQRSGPVGAEERREPRFRESRTRRFREDQYLALTSGAGHIAPQARW